MSTFIPESGNNGGRTFVAHPAGRFLSVCADVYYLQRFNNYYGKASKLDGKIDNYKTRNVIRLVFLSEHPQEDGKPSYVSQEFTASDNEKSNLYKFLVSWHPELSGKKLSKIDLDVLVGTGADITVTNRTSSDGRTFAGVSLAIAPRQGDQIPQIPSDFKRVDPRKKQEWEDKEINKHFPDWPIRFVDPQPGPSLSPSVGVGAPARQVAAAPSAPVQQAPQAASARPVFAPFTQQPQVTGLAPAPTAPVVDDGPLPF